MKRIVTAQSSRSKLDLRDKVTEFVFDELVASMDNIAIKCASKVDGYDADFCEDEASNATQIHEELSAAASEIAYSMLMNDPNRSKYY